MVKAAKDRSWDDGAEALNRAMERGVLYRRLGDLEAELEQLTMNTRRAPKCVRTAFGTHSSQSERTRQHECAARVKSALT